MKCFDVIVCLEDGYDSEVNDHDYDYESQVFENAYILYKTIEKHDHYQAYGDDQRQLVLEVIIVLLVYDIGYCLATHVDEERID